MTDKGAAREENKVSFDILMENFGTGLGGGEARSFGLRRDLRVIFTRHHFYGITDAQEQRKRIHLKLKIRERKF